LNATGAVGAGVGHEHEYAAGVLRRALFEMIVSHLQTFVNIVTMSLEPIVPVIQFSHDSGLVELLVKGPVRLSFIRISNDTESNISSGKVISTWQPAWFSTSTNGIEFIDNSLSLQLHFTPVRFDTGRGINNECKFNSTSSWNIVFSLTMMATVASTRTVFSAIGSTNSACLERL
jgi:hypothetical protein